MERHPQQVGIRGRFQWNNRNAQGARKIVHWTQPVFQLVVSHIQAYRYRHWLQDEYASNNEKSKSGRWTELLEGRSRQEHK